jgi:iron(III) transport system substrate-binding protein
MKKLPVLTAAVLALSLVGCAGSGQGATPPEAFKVGTMEELVTAAKAEGEVLLYTTLTEPDVAQLTQDFEAKYGIKVNTMRLGSNDAITRFDSESQAKAPSADLLLVAESRYFADGVEKGYVVPIEESGVLDLVPDYPKEFLVPDAGTAIVNVTNAGWVYNTDKVSKDELPKSWEDLLDPRWTGKLVGPPASDEINNLMTLSLVADQHGEEFLSKVHSQLKREYPDLVPMHEAVASGEGEIGLQSIEFFVDALAAGGAPLGFVSVPPGYYPIHALGVAAEAKHPAASRLLAEYLLSEEGSESVATGVGVYTPYDEGIPTDFKVPTIEKINEVEANKDAIQKAYK